MLRRKTYYEIIGALIMEGRKDLALSVSQHEPFINEIIRSIKNCEKQAHNLSTKDEVKRLIKLLEITGRDAMRLLHRMEFLDRHESG